MQTAEMRLICISDIHGSYDELRRLLNKVNFNENDLLLLLGDLWLRGKQPRETLEYIIELCKLPNVHALRGNWDALFEPFDEFQASIIENLPAYHSPTPEQVEFLKALPDIIDSGPAVFAHAGIKPGLLETQNPRFVLRNDAFADASPGFDNWVIVGHWPVDNYTPKIGCCNPFINHAKRIIAIDGGLVVRRVGQLNAFIVDHGEFSFASVDSLPTRKIIAAQAARGGEIYLTYANLNVELVEDRGEVSLYRSVTHGKTLEIGTQELWDNNGHLATSVGTDYWLPLAVGDEVSIVSDYPTQLLCKHNGTIGWVSANCLASQ